jgi:hypothetical protein
MTTQPSPAGEAAPVDRAAVLAAATDLLRRAGVTGPPTTIPTLLAACELADEQFAFTDPYSDQGLPVPLRHARADLRPLVRGMVDVVSKVIYTHRNLGAGQRRFVTLHELGHYVLPWHNSLLQYCSESDLSPAARQTWEREANLFAGACLFQGNRFTEEAARTPFGWPAVRRLAARYEASLEAAARQYTLSREGPCMLLIAGLRPDIADRQEATSGEPLLLVRYASVSPAWRRRYGPAGVLAPGTPLPWSHPATSVMLSPSRAVLAMPVDGPLGGDAAWPLRAELLSNGYEVLMLAMPGARPTYFSKGAG